MKKNHKLQFAFLLALLLCCAFRGQKTYAAEPTEYGNVKIQFMVDSVYQYKKSIQICFKNAETDKLYTVSCENFRDDVCDTQMPEGTWTYYSMQLENQAVYGAIGCLLDQESFTVSKNSVSEITVLVEEHNTETQMMNVELQQLNNLTFKGTVQIWMAGESDAYYTDSEKYSGSTYSGSRIKESYILRFDPNVGYTVPIDAGTYTITNINVYDENLNPMDVAYEKVIKIGRYNDHPQIQLSIWDAGTMSDIGDKYETKKATAMPAYSYVYYTRKVESFKETLGIEEESPFAELENQSPEEIEKGKQEEKAYQKWLDAGGRTEDDTVSNDSKNNVLPYVGGILLMFLSCGGVLYIFLKKRS